MQLHENARPGSLDPRLRVKRGVNREAQIARALREQAGLRIEDATEFEDKQRKVDRWIVRPEGRVALQIKYRESGNDLLFEVYDKFFGWNDPRNKVGRDMQGDANEYAVLLQDRTTVVMVPTVLAKGIINKMVEDAQTYGFTHTSPYGSVLQYFVHGLKLELRVQKDPSDQRQKMVAYIPADYFVAEKQAQVYEVALPRRW